MNTMLVWILISVSTGGYNSGNVQTVERFKTQQMCEHVRESIPKGSHVARCIQAEIIK